MKIVAETQSRRRVAKEKIQEKLQTNFAAVRRILIEDQQKSGLDQKKSVERRRKMKNVALHFFNNSGKGKGKGRWGKGKGKGKGQFVV